MPTLTPANSNLTLPLNPALNLTQTLNPNPNPSRDHYPNTNPNPKLSITLRLSEKWPLTWGMKWMISFDGEWLGSTGLRLGLGLWS
eukprot:1394184-Amorphochlora_amoeboformis.AAC.1